VIRFFTEPLKNAKGPGDPGMTTDTIKSTHHNTDLREKPDGDIHPAAEVGWYLQRERETLGHSLVDVAGELRVDPQYIHALEQGEIHHQLGWTYVLSYVRSYSDYLGFEPGPVVRHYKKILAEVPSGPTGADTDEVWPFSEVRARAAIATFAGVVGLMGAAGLVFQAEQDTDKNGSIIKPSSTNSEIFVPKKNEATSKVQGSGLGATPVSLHTGQNTQGSAVKINLLINAKPQKQVPTIAIREVPLPDQVSALKRSWIALQKLRDFNTARLAAVSDN